MLSLSEIFYSIQGESSFSGYPCVFVRLAECNLRCKYCDSKYSYSPEFYLSVKDVVSRVKGFDPANLVEITGGEPLLQDEIYELFAELKKLNFKILLETNGTIDLARVPSYVVKIVDVKCPGSGEQGKFFLNNLQLLNKQDELKFVLSDLNDYFWAKDFIKSHRIQESKVVFSCVLDKISPDVICEEILRDRLAVRFQLQLHKVIWKGDHRGK